MSGPRSLLSLLFARRALIAVLLVLAVGAGVWAVRVLDRDAPEVTTPLVREDGSYRVGSLPVAADQAAVRAAVEALPQALSYDHRSLDASLDAATALMTDSFGATFAETFDATTRPMALEKQAITSALVRGAGIVGSAEDGAATVIVYLDQVLVSSKDRSTSDPLKVSQNRVRVALREVDGDWLVDDIVPY